MQKIDKETEKKFLEAEKYRANKDFEKAISIFQDILDQYPKLPPALHNIAICFTEQKKFLEAEKAYLKCLNTEPVSILSINNLAKLYYNTGQFNKALPILKKSLLIKDDQETVVEVTAQCLFELNLTKQTDIFCSQALKKFPQNKYLKTFYGKNLLRLNRHSEGLKYLNESSGMIEFGEKDFKIV
jgi:tetratricopeptide (TPR) repeat protein|tara:strand:+ start:686 stop:1240 length:555 start_codon:yes stop_codon:yes gene_type:complete